MENDTSMWKLWVYWSVSPCHRESVSIGVNHFVFLKKSILFIVSSPTIKQAITRLKPFGCIVRQSHTEILSQEERERRRAREREREEKKRTNLKIYTISAHIGTMHTTGNSPGQKKKKPRLPHQLYRHRHVEIGKRQKKEDSVYFVSLSTEKNKT